MNDNSLSSLPSFIFSFNENGIFVGPNTQKYIILYIPLQKEITKLQIYKKIKKSKSKYLKDWDFSLYSLNSHGLIKTLPSFYYLYILLKVALIG